MRSICISLKAALLCTLGFVNKQIKSCRHRLYRFVFQISPIRVATCNLHGQKVKSGVTGLISTILVRHFVSTSGHFSNVHAGAGGVHSYSNTNTTGKWLQK